jgi:hypothetical protein
LDIWLWNWCMGNRNIQKIFYEGQISWMIFEVSLWKGNQFHIFKITAVWTLWKKDIKFLLISFKLIKNV